MQHNTFFMYTGETESTRILTSVEGGIRQYIIIQRHQQHTIPANQSYTGMAASNNNVPPSAAATPASGVTTSALNNVSTSASVKQSRLANILNHPSAGIDLILGIVWQVQVF